MKIKLDENLPAAIADMLRSHGHDVHTVSDEFLTGCRDDLVFDAAVREERMLITQDLDFSDVRKFKPGTHPGVVLLRLHNPSRRQLVECMRRTLDNEAIDHWGGCFVVVADHKLRIRRPPDSP